LVLPCGWPPPSSLKIQEIISVRVLVERASADFDGRIVAFERVIKTVFILVEETGECLLGERQVEAPYVNEVGVTFCRPSFYAPGNIGWAGSAF
jgi:hypothetical protein